MLNVCLAGHVNRCCALTLIKISISFCFPVCSSVIKLIRNPKRFSYLNPPSTTEQKKFFATAVSSAAVVER